MVEPTNREIKIINSSIALLSHPGKNRSCLQNIMKVMVERRDLHIDTKFEVANGATTAHFVAQYGSAE